MIVPKSTTSTDRGYRSRKFSTVTRIWRGLLLATLVIVIADGQRVNADERVDSNDSKVAADSNTNPERHALLVGCTKYPYADNVPELWGPANDVPAFADLLSRRFDFPDANIQRLVGWTDDQATRPTCANIVAAFERLIERSGPNSQIVILMTGHGTQAPIPESQQTATDPANPELDGLDEVFLPADFKGWTESGLQNAIVDDQMGLWLDQMKQRGASVWVIFDCCHSGTMTRDVQLLERHRGVKPQAIGVPPEALRSAAAKRAPAAERQRSVRAAEIDTLDLAAHDAKDRSTGHVTAFYAAQAFETAPELPRPADAARTPENYFGLLTYMLIQAFESQEQAMTYRDLGRRVISQYRAERGSRSPTPFFHGDLDHEVLGLSVFPERSSIILEHVGQKTSVSAGELMGITPGTILAVYAPDDRVQDVAKARGYVKVMRVTPGRSEVQSWKYNDHPTVALAELPNLARCEVVFQELGDMRLRLSVSPTDTADSHPLVAALDSLPPEIASLLRVVNDSESADWQLQVVSPVDAKQRFDRTVSQPTVLLFKGGEAELTDSRKVFAEYPVDEPALMARRMQGDLQKLFSWQNTWRIAQLATAEKSRSAQGIRLEVSRLTNDPSNASQTNISQRTKESADTFFCPGDELQVQVQNEGTQDMWVTLLYLDANFGIDIWFSEALKAGKSFTDGGTIDGGSIGAEGFIVLTIPVRGQKSQPAYEFLQQDGVGVTTRSVRFVPQRNLNPFEQLMSAAAFGKGKHRGLRRKATSTPEIISWSWVTVPAAPKSTSQGQHD